MLGEKCKVCGREMELRTGEHYRHTSEGRRLYKYVRQYTCPIGCPGAYFDFRHARPVEKRDRLFYFIPVPDKQVNLIDPLLIGGLGFFYIMFVAGIFAMGTNMLFKGLATIIITCFAVLLYISMKKTEENGNGEQPG